MGSHTKAASKKGGAGGRRRGRSATSTRRAASDAGVTSVLDSIRRIVRILRVASRTAEKECGLSAAQLFVLHILAEGTAMSLNDLAARTRTHQSSVSVVVQRLVDRGLVTRAAAPGDARRVRLSLLPAARALLRNSPDAPSVTLVSAVERIPPATRAGLAAGLLRLVTELGAADEPATMLFEDDAAPVRPAPRRPKPRGAGNRPSKNPAGSPDGGAPAPDQDSVEPVE